MMPGLDGFGLIRELRADSRPSGDSGRRAVGACRRRCAHRGARAGRGRLPGQAFCRAGSAGSRGGAALEGANASRRAPAGATDGGDDRPCSGGDRRASRSRSPLRTGQCDVHRLGRAAGCRPDRSRCLPRPLGSGHLRSTRRRTLDAHALRRPVGAADAEPRRGRRRLGLFRFRLSTTRQRGRRRRHDRRRCARGDGVGERARGGGALEPPQGRVPRDAVARACVRH